MDAWTLGDVATNPGLATWQVMLPSGELVVLRPLSPEDARPLGTFLEGLSPQTRRFWRVDSYDLAQAQALCDAIARYDKLDLVVATQAGPGTEIVGLMQFSFDLVPEVVRRFRGYGIDLTPGRDCRFGPCLADAYQGQGAGGALFPHVVEVARRFAQERILLWGGVDAANRRAIRFYEKIGFVWVGDFVARDGDACCDMLYEIQSES